MIELIVECSTYEKQEDIFAKIGRVKYRLPLIQSYVVEVDESDMNALKGITQIKNIHKNASITAQMNVARKVVKAETANGYTGRGVSIAVMDTGVSPVSDLTMPKNRIIAFKDMVNNKTTPYDDNGHGTHVA